MGRYIIKAWETQDDREKGMSDIIESNLSDIQKAIERAKELIESQNYNAIEVKDTKQKVTYYFRTPAEEKELEEEIEDAKVQEKINKYAKLVYNNTLQDDGENVSGLVADVVKHLQDIIKYFKTEKQELSKEEIDDIIKETNDLIEELEQNYDNRDYISLFTHSMSGFYTIDKAIKDILNDLLDYYESKLETMEFGEANITNVVDYYFDNNDIKNLMDYGADRDENTMPTISELYREILDELKIKYERIYTEEISDGKYSTIISFDKNNEIIIDISAWNRNEELSENIESIKQEYIRVQKKLKNEKIEKIKTLNLTKYVEDYYCTNIFKEMVSSDEYKTINKKELLSNMYEEILKKIEINVAFVTIDEINKNKYKTTVVFSNGRSDYYYSKDMCSKETAIKNIENMRESYIKMQQEIEQNEQDMEME